MIHQLMKMGAFFLPTAASRGDANWMPCADIYKSCRGWMIKLDLAGVDQRDVVIEASGRRLTISRSP
jgi:HSP20 family molecular chaperone IbpA